MFVIEAGGAFGIGGFVVGSWDGGKGNFGMDSEVFQMATLLVHL